MALILGIESSTTVCSAALHRDGVLLAAELIDVPNSAASQLAVMIDSVLKTAGVKPGELNAVAVSSGPGSYTGLRIAVATAKGLCFALGIPLIAVGSLELMAFQVNMGNKKGAMLCPMIDARRMEVYTMLLTDRLQVLEPVTAAVIDASSFSSRLESGEILFFGNGSDKVKTVIAHPNATFVPGIFPHAQWLGTVALEKFRQGLFEDAGEFEPAYLKDFVVRKPATR